jgi:hypothetical protein
MPAGLPQPQGAFPVLTGAVPLPAPQTGNALGQAKGSCSSSIVRNNLIASVYLVLTLC